MLCNGLLWTNRVKALSRSDRVPDWMIFERKLASDEEELEEDDVWKVLISFS